MRARPFGSLLCVSVLMILSIHAITAQESGLSATLVENTLLREGPGDTYSEVGWFNGGTDVEIVERNRTGLWLRVEVAGTESDGWTLTGFLILPEGIRFSEVAVSDLPDADTRNVEAEDLARLYSVPIIPELSAAMLDVYEQGRTRGNDRRTITKMGDSNSANPYYLSPIAGGQYALGAYDMLETVIETFAPSLAEDSIAARVGLNAFSIFDPIWSPTRCNVNEGPLACELRLKRPVIAVIMFGPNDIRTLNSEQYTEQMTRIVEDTLAAGVIPLLSTFSSDPAEDTWSQAVRFNNILLDIAGTYEVPVVNLWSAARALPNYGIGEDKVHLTLAGASITFEGQETRFGVTMQNLIVLTALDEIRQTLDIEPTIWVPK